MDAEITLNAPSSVILAEGKRRSPFGFWAWLALGLLSLLLLALGGFWFALSRPLQIPAGPHILISASAYKLNKVTPEAISSLPNEWQKIFKNNSDWPVVFGLYQDQAAWNWFAVMPRWFDHGDLEVVDQAGLAKVVGISVTDTEIFRYNQQFSWHGLWQKPLAFRLDSQILADLIGLPVDDAWPTVTGKLEGTILVTDLPVKNSETQISLKDADLSLNIDSLATEGAAFSKLAELLADQHSNLGLPPPRQWSVWLEPNGVIKQTLILFSDKLTAPQAGALLGAHGFSARKTVQLPDESLGVERVAPYATNTADLLGIRTNAQGQEVELGEQSLRLTQVGQNAPVFEAIPKCGQFFKEPNLLVSSQIIETLLTRLGKQLEFPAAKIFVGKTKNRLSLCISR